MNVDKLVILHGEARDMPDWLPVAMPLFIETPGQEGFYLGRGEGLPPLCIAMGDVASKLSALSKDLGSLDTEITNIKKTTDNLGEDDSGCLTYKGKRIGQASTIILNPSDKEEEQITLSDKLVDMENYMNDLRVKSSEYLDFECSDISSDGRIYQTIKYYDRKTKKLVKISTVSESEDFKVKVINYFKYEEGQDVPSIVSTETYDLVLDDDNNVIKETLRV